MIEVIKKHWKTYLMEFAGIAGFVLIAGLLTIFLEHPDLPVMKSWLKDYPLIRRIPLGIILGIYIAAVILLIGKKTGAHINPSATWTFFRIGKINFTDAFFFTIAQFAGAISAAQLLKYTVSSFGHPLINYGNTEPKPPHTAIAAFTAEFIISFILMLVLLRSGSSKRLEKFVPLISGILIALYLIIEIPFSGMSLNPARSFAGSFASGKWQYLWIYFVAPTLAMLAAGEAFTVWKRKQLGLEDYEGQPIKIRSIRRDYHEIPHYPADSEA